MDKDDLAKIIAKKERRLIISFFLLSILIEALNILTIDSFWGILIFTLMIIIYYLLFSFGIKSKSRLILGLLLWISIVVTIFGVLILIIVIANKNLAHEFHNSAFLVIIDSILIALLLILNLTTIVWTLQLYSLIVQVMIREMEEAPVSEEPSPSV